MQVGIVIPVYGHSRLVGEALKSALEQTYAGPIEIVAVVDGDHDHETSQTIEAFQAAYPGQIHAIHRENGRLPAARNTGVRFLLNLFPALGAIYFLDADNRLSAHSIEAFAMALADKPDAAWAYPDITFFGIGWEPIGADVRVTAPRYSVLRHLIGNICEAGSMVRASVFRAGIFYDESFSTGFEDWEFWLQCIKAGLRGTRAKDAGFLYRRRADSMLAEANRSAGAIISRIRDKHAVLFSDEFVRGAYAEEFWPFLFVSERERTLITLDGKHLALDGAAVRNLADDVVQRFHFAYLPRIVLSPLNDAVVPTKVVVDVSIDLLRKNIAGSLPRYLDAQLTSSDEKQAKYEVFRCRDVFGLVSRETWPKALSALRADFQTALLAPRPGASSRYAGPASFQIDSFVIGDTRAPAPSVTAATLPSALLVVEGARRQPSGIESTLAQLFTLTEIDAKEFLEPAHASLDRMAYTGAVIDYRSLTPRYRDLAGVAHQFPFTFLLDSFALLLNCGELKSARTAISFVASQLLGSRDIAALCASEHALTWIVCHEDDVVRLRSSGIPRRKLVGHREVREEWPLKR